MTHGYPRLRPYSRGEVAAPTGPESVRLDRYAIDEVGVPQPVLMENAGRSAAAVLHRLFPAGPVVGLVGAGNNGGDALVLLRTLRTWGREVAAVLVADRPEGDPLLHGWPVSVVGDAELDEEGWSNLLGRAAVIVDGILGTGVHGAPRERQARVIERMNACDRPILAIDVPSGADATTGAVPGVAVRADVTVAFGAPKLGTLFHPARSLAGRVIAVEIAFPPWKEGPGAVVVTPQWARERAPRRGTDTHKKAVGSVLVVAGEVGMAGAALLAGTAAFRAGAGLVRICSAPQNRPVIQSGLPEAIYVDSEDAQQMATALAATDAVVVGPGLGASDRAAGLVSSVLTGDGPPALLDADALNLAAAGAVDLEEAARRRPLLLTPHPGEMSRLLAGESHPSPDATARVAAARFGCAVLLKGAPSVVAAPRGPVLVDSQTSSDLAVAGMGDALSGVCGALMARGLEPRLAGATALYFTGRAARIAGRGAGLVPSDVVRWLPDALGETREARTDLDLPFVTFDADPAD